jgi:hypothetical protein
MTATDPHILLNRLLDIIICDDSVIVHDLVNVFPHPERIDLRDGWRSTSAHGCCYDGTGMDLESHHPTPL